ncbi:MAG: hypothetical protein JSR36_12505 [Proteobacteria bacterium]|nr:hypothetical protein [Pseudomonadota bacterium]
MNLRAILMTALIAACLWNGWHRLEGRPVHPSDGQIAPEEPVQSPAAQPGPLRMGRWMLTPRAAYDITARILSREDYRFDPLSELVPEDLALGWGPMSDNAVLAHFEVTQGARFYTWQPRGPLPIARDTVISHSANTHVIPADAGTRSQLARLRVGQVVHLRGLLVDGKRDDGAYFSTSLTREDSGAGACEVLLVEHVDVR